MGKKIVSHMQSENPNEWFVNINDDVKYKFENGKDLVDIKYQPFVYNKQIVYSAILIYQDKE